MGTTTQKILHLAYIFVVQLPCPWSSDADVDGMWGAWMDGDNATTPVSAFRTSVRGTTFSLVAFSIPAVGAFVSVFDLHLGRPFDLMH